LRQRNNNILLELTILSLLALLLVGCSENSSIAIRYKAEKLLRQAEKAYEAAGIRPDLRNLEQWKKIKASYMNVAEYAWKYLDSVPLEKYPEERQELESIAFMAVNRLSSIYYFQRNYDSSIIILHKLLAVTTLKGTPLLTSELYLARTLQANGNWSEAMRVFRSIIDTFYPPVDNENHILTEALNLPFELVRVYRLLGDSSAFKDQIQSAKSYYERLAAEWPNSALCTDARSNLARLYLNEEEWDKTIENLRQIKDSTGQIDLEAATMIADITSSGKKNYPAAISLYDELLKKSQDSMLTAALHARKGKAFFESGNYNKCREIMAFLKDNYPRYFQNNPIPQNYIAMSFAQEGKWSLAEDEFRWLTANYSTTEQAFNAFFVIADHYQQSGDVESAEKWYRQAEEFYDKIGRQYSGSAVEASAMSYKAEVARREEKWETAIKYLEEINDKFPQSEIGQNALLNAAAVYREKLDDPQKAEALITRLKRELLPIGEGKKTELITDVKK